MVIPDPPSMPLSWLGKETSVARLAHPAPASTESEIRTVATPLANLIHADIPLPV